MTISVKFLSDNLINKFDFVSLPINKNINLSVYHVSVISEIEGVHVCDKTEDSLTGYCSENNRLFWGNVARQNQVNEACVLQPLANKNHNLCYSTRC